MSARVPGRWIERARQIALPFARFALRPEHRREALHDWQRRWRGEPALPEPTRRVLVVCHGNICRSPYAEALLRARCTSLEVRSAGFAAGDGNPADPTAIAVARERGVDLGPHRARILLAEDLDWADLLLVMTAAQVEQAVRLGAALSRLRLLGDYLVEPPYAIADPYGMSPAVFRECFTRIDAAIERLRQHLDAAR